MWSDSRGHTPVSWVLVRLTYVVRLKRSHSCVLGSFWFVLCGQTQAVTLLCPGFFLVCLMWSDSSDHTLVSWVLFGLSYVVRLKRSHSCVLGSCSFLLILVRLTRSHSRVLVFYGLSYVVRLKRSHSCVLGSFWFVLCGQTHAVTLLRPGFFLVCLMWSDSSGHTPVSWVLFGLSYVVRLTRSHSRVLGSCSFRLILVRLTRSHSCVLGSFWFVLCGQTHAVTLLCPGFFLVCLMWSDSSGHTPVSWVLFGLSYVVRLTRSHSCVLGSCSFRLILVRLKRSLSYVVRLTRSLSCDLGSFCFVLCGQTHAGFVLCGQTHAVTLLRPGFFLVCLMWSDSRGHTPVSWVLFGLSYVVRLTRSHSCVLGSCSFRLILVRLKRSHSRVLVFYGLSYVVRLTRSHSCVLDSFWFVLCGQTHAVTLLCPGFFLVCLMWSDSSGHTPVSWVLFGLSYVVRLKRSHSCVLGSFWFVFCGQTHVVTLLCPGFFLVCLMWSDSRGHTPVSWVLFGLSYVVRLKRSHSCVLGSFWFVLCGQTQAVTLLCPGFFLVCLMWSDSRGHTPVSWVLFGLSYVVRLTRSHSCEPVSWVLFGCLMWSDSRGHTPVSWVLFGLSYVVRLTRSHSCVLGSFWFVLCGQTHAVTLLCPGFLFVFV